DVAQAGPPLVPGSDFGPREPGAVARAPWAGREDARVLLKLLDEPPGQPGLPVGGLSLTAAQGAAVDALARLQEPRAAAPIARMLPDFFRRERAVRALEALGPAAEGEVVKYYFDADAGARDEARKLLTGYRTKEGVILTQALEELHNRDDQRRREALDYLRRAPVEEARRAEVVAALTALFDDNDPGSHAAAGLALARWAGKEDVPLLLKLLDEPGGVLVEPRSGFTSGSVKGAAVEALGVLPEPRAAAPIARLLPEAYLRERAVRTLAAIGPAAEKEVARYYFDSEAGLREAARKLLTGYRTKESVILAQALEELRGRD